MRRKEGGRRNRWCEFHPEACPACVNFPAPEGSVGPARSYINDVVAHRNPFGEAWVLAQARARAIG